MPALVPLGGYRHGVGDAPHRLARSAAFAAVSLGLAVGAHVLAGGAAPGWTVAMAALGGLLALGWLLSRRERSGAQLGALVVGTQALLHVSFVAVSVIRALRAGNDATAALAALLLCHHGTAAVSAAQVRAAAAGLHLQTTLLPAEPSGLAATLLSPQALGMLAAHLVAAGALAWWLRRGERAVWAAARRVVRWLAPSWTPAPSRRAAGAASITGPLWIVTARLGAGAQRGRGPPRRAVVAMTFSPA